MHHSSLSMLLQVLSLQIPNQFQYPLTVTTTTFVSPSLDYTTNFDTTNVDTANHKNNNPSFEFILLSIVTDRISTSDNDNNSDNDNANTPTDATSNIIYLTFNVTGASTSTYPTKTTNNMIYPTGESILPLIVTFPFMRRHEGGEGHEESEESSDLLPSFPDALNPELDNISFISPLLLQSTSSLLTPLFTQLLTQSSAPSADPPPMPPEQLLPVLSTFALLIIPTTVPSSVPEGDYYHPTISFSPEGDHLRASTILATFPSRGQSTNLPTARGSTEPIRLQKFPLKLYSILVQKGFQNIIAWMPHERSWKVHSQKFSNTHVMPMFFEYSNYHSLNRLINARIFRRVSSGLIVARTITR
mmetsp:Transcript_37531/g.43203  ORF Transcript_37531/g.43203 Transcript_37531/m.43203 type:complete len:359 (+) Transcript_37531:665-1741(+)